MKNEQANTLWIRAIPDRDTKDSGGCNTTVLIVKGYQVNTLDEALKQATGTSQIPRKDAQSFIQWEADRERRGPVFTLHSLVGCCPSSPRSKENTLQKMFYKQVVNKRTALVSFHFIFFYQKTIIFWKKRHHCRCWTFRQIYTKQPDIYR